MHQRDQAGLRPVPSVRINIIGLDKATPSVSIPGRKPARDRVRVEWKTLLDYHPGFNP